MNNRFQANYRCKYEYEYRFGHPQHTWSVVGACGGLHLHIMDYGADAKYGEQFQGGIEIHYRQPPDYMCDQAPSHDECWLLKQPCWHDGSSLQVSEYWIPLWRVDPTNHVRMFEMLCGRADESFVGKEGE
jgi:hypothetical protein